MKNDVLISFLCTLAFVFTGLGAAQAAPCTVSLSATNPDGSLTSSTDCGMTQPMGPGEGHSSTRTGAGINDADPGNLGLTWTFVDRDPGTDVVPIETALAITGANTPSGTWRINTDLVSEFDSFVLTMKGGSPLQDSFLWFLVDTNVGANVCSAADQLAGWDLCGSWNMYGVLQGRPPGTPTAKDLSHMDLFAALENPGPEPQNPPGRVPEPSMLLLVATGMLALALRRRARASS